MQTGSPAGRSAKSVEKPGDVRRESLQKVLSSSKFSQAPRLSAFLQYVAEKAIAGLPEDATEQPIGVHVFGRNPGYNPAEDNVVRSTARQVRERLALYYQEEGAGDELRIELTRGTYLPRFEPRTVAAPGALAPVGPAVPQAMAPEPRPAPELVLRRAWWRWVVAGGAAACATAAGVAVSARRDPFWDLLLGSPRTVILVPGDSGTVMRQNLTGKVVRVPEYASRNLPTAEESGGLDPSLVEDLGSRRYTSFSDLRFASRLSMQPQIRQERFVIRYARDLHVEDLKGSNAVLVGAPQGNPWVELFDKDLNFHIVSDEMRRTLTVVNRRPQAGESATYTYAALERDRRAFAMIALTSNLDRTGAVLLVQGTTVAGIEGATDFLFRESAMRPVIGEAMAGGRGLRRFELLLETGFVAASGVGAAVRAKRFWDWQ